MVFYHSEIIRLRRADISVNFPATLQAGTTASFSISSSPSKSVACCTKFKAASHYVSSSVATTSALVSEALLETSFMLISSPAATNTS